MNVRSVGDPTHLPLPDPIRSLMATTVLMENGVKIITLCCKTILVAQLGQDPQEGPFQSYNNE